jgi:hypothetical protein
MPEFIKIGFTHGDVEQRIRQLDRTGVPLPFEIYYAASVEDAKLEEEWLHSIFADRRARNNREFSKMNPEYAALALKKVEIKEVVIDSNLTPEQEKEIDALRQKRSRFHFANYGIPIGSKLTFTRDHSIIAKVVANDKIELNGKIDSMSNTAMRLLGYKTRPQGTLYFEFEDEILDDRRRRIESED